MSAPERVKSTLEQNPSLEVALDVAWDMANSEAVKAVESLMDIFQTLWAILQSQRNIAPELETKIQDAVIGYYAWKVNINE